VTAAAADAPPGAIEAIRVASGRPGLLAAWLVLTLALSGPALSSFQSAVAAPLASSIAQHFGGGDHGALIAQLTLVLPAAGVFLGGPLTGWLIGRWGYRPVIVGNALLLAAAGSAGAWLDATIPFLAARLLVGLGAVALYSAMVALTGLLFQGVTLARMISYQSGLAALLGMALTLAAGAVASRFGWRASFLIYLATSLFALIAALAWLPPARAKGKAGGGGSLLPLLPTLLMAVGSFTAIYLVTIQGSLLMSANGIGEPSVQSVVIAISSLANAVLATACSWVERHVLGRWLYPAALTLMAAGALIMGALPALWGAALGSLLLGAGAGLAVSYLIRIVVERAPPDARERAAGLIAPAFYVAQFANPLIMQPLRVTIGVQWAFMLVGLLLFAGAGWAVVDRSRAGR
jgi:MFS family permease